MITYSSEWLITHHPSDIEMTAIQHAISKSEVFLIAQERAKSLRIAHMNYLNAKLELAVVKNLTENESHLTNIFNAVDKFTSKLEKEIGEQYASIGTEYKTFILDYARNNFEKIPLILTELTYISNKFVPPSKIINKEINELKNFVAIEVGKLLKNLENLI